MTPVSAYDEHGGCVRASSKLVLRDVVVRDCSAKNDGGGVYVNYGLTIERSTISGSVAGSCGGGVGGLFRAVIAIVDSTIEGNSAENGGGICSRDVRLKIANSTISGNVASNEGAACSSPPGGWAR
jgi:predicted outer membrane repeat protein